MGSLIIIIRKLENSIAWVEKAIVCLALGTMLLLSSSVVLMRNFEIFKKVIQGLLQLLHINIDLASGGDLIVRHLVLFILFFGASLSTRSKQHLQMDLSHKLIPEKIRPLAGLFINAFCIFINYLLMIAAFHFYLAEKAAGDEIVGIPSWYFIGVMPLGFALFTFHYIVNLLENILNLFGFKKDILTICNENIKKSPEVAIHGN